jgi:SOS response regulatory protein OraA/RecX
MCDAVEEYAREYAKAKLKEALREAGISKNQFKKARKKIRIEEAKAAKKVAIRMLKAGKYDFEEISEITELSFNKLCELEYKIRYKNNPKGKNA